jgi:hypothetical protein
MTFDSPLEDALPDEIEIDRGDTGIRILFTLLFFVIARVVEGMLMILVLFELGVTLVTQREPSPAIRRFANHTLSYLVRIGRYITYNDDDAPFPFDEFPGELDLTVPAPRAID